MKFLPNLINTFYFKSFDFQTSKSKAIFNYSFDDGTEFVEEIIFHNVATEIGNEKLRALNNCLKYLHLVLGISYYKAAVPEKIVIENYSISEDIANFFNSLYIKGLGEFAYNNKLNLNEKVRFPFSLKRNHLPSFINLPECIAIPVGGGKDSIVTLDVMKSTNKSLMIFSLGDFDVTRKIAIKANLPYIFVERRLSPTLFKINEKGAYNGHVPFSAILAFILPIAAILYGFNIAVLSNERSANVGNLVYNGIEVNHQYSKSFEFEKQISNFLKKYLLSNFNYFSFLRPLSDIGIAKLFSKLDYFHNTFISCNSAFKIQKNNQNQEWCLKCPKCRFTFLALSPFIEKKKLISIFGSNLLNDKNQIIGFDELIGIKGHKPFECVGELNESIAAFILLSRHSNWNKDLIVQRFIKFALPSISAPDDIVNSAFSFSEKHLLPNFFYKVLYAYFRS